MNKPTLSQTHLQFTQASALTQNCKRVCLCQRYQHNGKESPDS